MRGAKKRVLRLSRVVLLPYFFSRRLRSVPQLTENSLQEAMARLISLLHYGETCE